MKDCLQLTKTFARKLEIPDSKKKGPRDYDLTSNSYDRYGNYKEETTVDFSNDIVVQKLRRMLP